MGKKQTNEGVIGASKKFLDAFFDGLKNNTADRFIKKAHSAKMDPRVLEKMKEIEQRKRELDDLLS